MVMGTAFIRLCSILQKDPSGTRTTVILRIRLLKDSERITLYLGLYTGCTVQYRQYSQMIGILYCNRNAQHVPYLMTVLSCYCTLNQVQ